MATVLHRQPVAVSHPLTEQFITLARGMEFEDTDPIVAAYGWAFEDEGEPLVQESVPIVPAQKRAKRA